MARALVLGAMLGLSACTDERDPKKPLTADEGASLLQDLRRSPSRAQALTPAEKKYLSETVRKK